MIKKSIPLSNIVNWDEIRIYATKQDLGSVTLESANIKDPRVKKFKTRRKHTPAFSKLLLMEKR
jgi:hypothetical protein